jgi:hypothetical protein
MQQTGYGVSSCHFQLNHLAAWIRTSRGFRLETMRANQQSNRREFKTPTLPNQRVGHPEEPNQSPGVDVLEWNNLTGRFRQQGNLKGLATRPIYFVRSQWKGEERPLDKYGHQV